MGTATSAVLESEWVTKGTVSQLSTDYASVIYAGKTEIPPDKVSAITIPRTRVQYFASE